MKKTVVYLLLILAAFNTAAFAQQDTLTLEECIDIAQKNNPLIKQAEGAYDFSDAAYTASRSPLYPQLLFQSGWIKNGGTFFFGPTARPANYENYNAGLQLQQLLYDFGKSYSRVSATEDLRKASREDLSQARQDLTLSAYTAYFNLLLSEKMSDISKETMLQAEEHSRQAKAMYDLGKKPRYDVLKASTDLANARLNNISTDNDIRIAKLQLENVMNDKIQDGTVLKDYLEVKYDSLYLSDAVETALKNRPEIISAKYRVEANRSLFSSAWDANLPTLSATASYNFRTYSLKEPFQKSYNIGLNLSVPVFQGFAIDAETNQANANLKIAEANLDLVTQSVRLEVSQQYSGFLEARQRISAADYLVSQSEETMKLADARYREGLGSPLEITDARVTLFNAKTTYIQALYNYQITYAKLLKAMGTLK